MKSNVPNKETKKIEGLRYQKKGNNLFGKYKEPIIAIIVISVIGLAGYFYLQQQNEQKKFSIIEYENQDLEQQLITRDSLINEWVALFDQVHKDLATIREKENMLSMSTEDMELDASKRESILTDIQMLGSLIEVNKRKIASLNSRLRKSGAKITNLEKKIEELNHVLALKDKSIDSLQTSLFERDSQLAELHLQVNDMETSLGQKEAMIENQENELNKAFVAFGSPKELLEKGLVRKEGGFLGIGKTKIPNTEFSQEFFTAVDITTTTEIPVHAKDIEFITKHPEGSYKLIQDEEEKLIAYIEIQNPDEFWKLSRYAIFETDN